MSRRPSPLRLLPIVFTLVLTAGPVSASGLSIFGSYLDLDEPDGALGIGVRSEFSLGERWALFLTTSYHEKAAVELSPDLVAVEVDDELRLLPSDLGLRYVFGDEARTSIYVGGGYSYLTVDSEIGRSDGLHGFFGTVGTMFGDDSGPRFFVEGSLRSYGDVDVELFEGLDSDDVAEVGADGFSVAFGIHWDIGR